MKKKRLIALILCLCMVFSSALSVSAAEISGTDADAEVTQEVEETGDDKQSEDVRRRQNGTGRRTRNS